MYENLFNNKNIKNNDYDDDDGDGIVENNDGILEE